MKKISLTLVFLLFLTSLSFIIKPIPSNYNEVFWQKYAPINNFSAFFYTARLTIKFNYFLYQQERDYIILYAAPTRYHAAIATKIFKSGYGHIPNIQLMKDIYLYKEQNPYFAQSIQYFLNTFLFNNAEKKQLICNSKENWTLKDKDNLQELLNIPHNICED